MFSLADELLYSTINLVRFKDGIPVGTGTGFFWTKQVGNERELTVIITNKHVVHNADWIQATCHEANEDGSGPSGRIAECRVGNGPSTIIMHPNEAIDLCAIIFGDIINQAAANGRSLFYKTVSAENVPDEEAWELFDSIEDVIMVGCPRGIYDQHNNIPIVRRGITATPLSKFYEGRPEFMVDMACFPGSSGSPVYMLQRGGYFDRKAGVYTLAGARFYFLGVLYCGPVITHDGRVVLSQQPKITFDAMMHLGQVIRSSALLELDATILRLYEESKARTANAA